MHKDLTDQVFKIGKSVLHDNFFVEYSDLFDQNLKNISGNQKPEKYNALILEKFGKVVGFSLVSTLVTEEALFFRLLGLPVEIQDYVMNIGPKKVGSIFTAWIDPQQSLKVQHAISEIFESHMTYIFEKSPAEILLNVPQNYNPNGYTCAEALTTSKGYIPFTKQDDYFYKDFLNKDYAYDIKKTLTNKEWKILGRKPITIKGLTVNTRSKIDFFTDRYALNDKQEENTLSFSSYN